jgi:hypothetical protein
MKKFRVYIPVDTYEVYEIEALSAESAKELVIKGNGEPVQADFYEVRLNEIEIELESEE